MSIKNKNVLSIIKKVKQILDTSNISYWLGRGVLGDLLVNKELKCKHSDVDFHILNEDRETLRSKLLPEFKNEYEIDDKDYKLAFYKPIKNPEFYFEFPYIFNDPVNSNQVYHISCEKNRYCPKECFDIKKFNYIEIENIKVRIPTLTEEYFKNIYDGQWKNRYKLRK